MKFVQMLCGLISIMTWMSTHEETLNRIAGRAAPKVTQVAQAETAGAASSGGTGEPQPSGLDAATKEALEKKLATDNAYMTGEYEAVTNSGEKYKFWIQFETTYWPKGTLEGEGLQSNVLVSFEKAERNTSYFRAKIDAVSPTQFTVALDRREIGQFLKSPSVSYDSVDYVPEKLMITSTNLQTWDLGPTATDYTSFKFKGRVMKMPTQSLDRFVGLWKGKIGENEFQLELKSNGPYLTGMYRAVMAYPCRFDEINVRLAGENRFSLIGGKSHATESYSGCDWPAMRGQLMTDGKLRVLDYGRGEEMTEGTLTR